MSVPGKLGERIGDKIAEVWAQSTAKVIGTGILAMLAVGWVFVWHHINPTFDYTARSSSLSSHFVSLSEILYKVEVDSHLYCGGGLEQLMSAIGWRTCYHFAFVPPDAYKLMVCAHDEATAKISTSDQRVALRYFERKFAPLSCFAALRNGSKHGYNIVFSKDTLSRKLQFANDAPQNYGFCGCSADEEKQIASAINASLL
jgi:hypothetical protein